LLLSFLHFPKGLPEIAGLLILRSQSVARTSIAKEMSRLLKQSAARCANCVAFTASLSALPLSACLYALGLGHFPVVLDSILASVGLVRRSSAAAAVREQLAALKLQQREALSALTQSEAACLRAERQLQDALSRPRGTVAAVFAGWLLNAAALAAGSATFSVAGRLRTPMERKLLWILCAPTATLRFAVFFRLSKNMEMLCLCLCVFICGYCVALLAHSPA